MLAAAIAAFVYLRILVAMYLEDGAEDLAGAVAVPLGARVVIGVSCLGVLAVGIVPGPLMDLARDAVPVLVGG